MLNKIKQSVPYLVSQAGKAIGGMTLYGEALGLPHASGAGFDLKLADTTDTLSIQHPGFSPAPFARCFLCLPGVDASFNRSGYFVSNSTWVT